ncbi:MAG: cofactor-independent phosphoglycerate mutase [Actinomycetes bacterium]
MNYVVCVPDGCADEPVDELGGRTPLEAASLPNLAALAARGEVGRAAVIPAGMAPGSDVGNMSIFGYDPATYHTGRAPIEAAALGIRLRPDQVAYRCNLVEVVAGQMADFSGGHPSTEAASEVVRALEAELGGDGISFHPGVEYRHIMVAPGSWSESECVPPHDLSDKPVVLPTGLAAPELRRLMDASRKVLERFDLSANQIWLWGQGFQPQMPSFSSVYGVDAALSSAVDLVRGLGVLTDIEVVDVEGMTPGYDTNYGAQRECALDSLADGADLFIIHVEATDEAGHAGDVAEKVRALENWDSQILADLVPSLDRLGPWRMLLLPDHATPLRLKTHTSDPVPYLLVDSAKMGRGGRYTEAGVEGLPAVPGHSLMEQLTRR